MDYSLIQKDFRSSFFFPKSSFKSSLMIQNLAPIDEALGDQCLQHIQGRFLIAAATVHTDEVPLMFIELPASFFFRVMLLYSFMHLICPFKLSIAFVKRAWKRSPS